MNLRFGIVSEMDTARGFVRVDLDEDSIVTDWLPVSQPRAMSDKFFTLPEVGELVWCVLDDNVERGVVGGALYNAKDIPIEGQGAQLSAVEFSDGSRFEYDKESGKYTAKVGTTEQNLTANGHTIKRGSESLKSILEDLIDAILTETHPTGTGPSGTPINAATYTAIKNRIPNLLVE